jgi:hypothetical protein
MRYVGCVGEPNACPEHGRGPRRTLMERYIGTKVVLAEPCAKDSASGKLLRPGDETTGPVLPGYKVVYEDGYESWSPKGTFERAYRLVTQAELDLLKQ